MSFSIFKEKELMCVLCTGLAGIAVLYKMRNRCSVAENFQKGKGLSKCTCDNMINCDKHDQQLLKYLAKKISSGSKMVDLGVELGIDLDEILICQGNHVKDIFMAAVIMLYDVWYKTQDGLGPQSKGLKTLKEAISNSGMAKYNIEINKMMRDRTKTS